MRARKDNVFLPFTQAPQINAVTVNGNVDAAALKAFANASVAPLHVDEVADFQLTNQLKQLLIHSFHHHNAINHNGSNAKNAVKQIT